VRWRLYRCVWPSRRPGGRRLLSRSQCHSSFFQLVDDVLQILQGAGKPVDARNDKSIAWPKKIEQDLKLGSAVTACAARFFGANHVATGPLQCCTLNAEVLFE
jgi:hypothetical protein